VQVLCEYDGESLDCIEGKLKEIGIEFSHWLRLLLKEELVFECPEIFRNSFPPLDLVVQRPLKIDTAVLYFTRVRSDIMDILERFGCQHVAILLRKTNLTELNKIWRIIDDISITSVSLHFTTEVDHDWLTDIITNASHKLRFVSVEGEGAENPIPSIPGSVSLHRLSPRFRLGYYQPCLILNQEVYLDALQRNVYFNRKIFIDEYGRIGCGDGYWSTQHKPNIIAHALKDYLTAMDIPSIWSARKDDIDICKDCELRYMCVDPRIPKRRKDGTLFYENECAYNPYISKWHDQSGYLPLSDSGVYNSDQGVTIDHERIAAINAELWGE